jgi:hypothetical protein
VIFRLPIYVGKHCNHLLAAGVRRADGIADLGGHFSFNPYPWTVFDTVDIEGFEPITGLSIP